MKGKRRAGYPSYYSRNVIQQAEHRYLRTGKTEARRIEEKRRETEDELADCFLTALQEGFAVPEEKIEEIKSRVNQISRSCREMERIQGVKQAQELLKKQTEGFMPERFSLPLDQMPRKAKELNELAAVRSAAEATAQILALAAHGVMKYNADELHAIFEATKSEYRRREFAE